MSPTVPELTAAFNWVGKGEHPSKLNLVFIAGNGDQGRTRELDRINLTRKHIFRDEIRFFLSWKVDKVKRENVGIWWKLRKERKGLRVRSEVK